jgi:hypothetical protein
MDKMKIGMIYQPCGLGDILFLQKLAYSMKDEGYEVYWPVVHELEKLNDYIPEFNFVSWSDKGNLLKRPPLPDNVNFPYKSSYLPETPTNKTDEFYFFQGFANHQPVMAGKYNSIGMDWSDWRDYIKFDRNLEKEKELYYDVLGLKDDDEYILVGNKYGTRPQVYEYNIPIPKTRAGSKIIYLDILENFFIFDWCKVFENAQEVCMIETSFNYLLESSQMFNIMKTKKLNLYHRNRNFYQVQYLFNLPWNYLI